METHNTLCRLYRNVSAQSHFQYQQVFSLLANNAHSRRLLLPPLMSVSSDAKPSSSGYVFSNHHLQAADSEFLRLKILLEEVEARAKEAERQKISATARANAADERANAADMQASAAEEYLQSARTRIKVAEKRAKVAEDRVAGTGGLEIDVMVSLLKIHRLDVYVVDFVLKSGPEDKCDLQNEQYQRRTLTPAVEFQSIRGTRDSEEIDTLASERWSLYTEKARHKDVCPNRRYHPQFLIRVANFFLKTKEKLDMALKQLEELREETRVLRDQYRSLDAGVCTDVSPQLHEPDTRVWT